MKKLSLFILLVIFAFQAKAQYTYPLFINSTESQVKAFMKQQNGIITSERLISAYFAVPAHKELNYRLPEANTSKNDIYTAHFSLTKEGLCYQYNITYQSDRFLNNVIKQFDKPGSGFKRVPGLDLHWIKPHLDVQIFNRSGDARFTTFILRVKKD